MQVKVKERNQISPSLVYYLVVANQLGVGVLGFEQILSHSVGNEAWIVVLIGGLTIYPLIWMIYRICEQEQSDVMGIHEHLLGKWVGSFVNLLWMGYGFLIALVIIRTYLEVLQVWLFPSLNEWVFASMFLILSYYVISGGFRTVTGIAYFSILLTTWLVFTTVYTYEFAHPSNLLPIFHHKLGEFVQGLRENTLSYLGFELLLIYYPFIKQAEKSRKWAYLGHSTTVFFYLFAVIASTMYYSQGELAETIWSSINKLKMVELPFLERFEYLAVAVWISAVLPNLCMGLWVASRIGKKIWGGRQRHILVVMILVCLLLTGMIEERETINNLNNWLAMIGFYLIYVYIPLLFLWVTWRGRRGVKA
ncbi:spore germination protein [Mechercharimyces sp. CAU 1602]|uniref:GerAB/ArcD/ProY family transporter n=1 Tax=Mechercharimyces sp. CAU 1602 TaxID=2973933 RepID=UPI002161B6F9|nr:spore germination protein [Mechercharimyces sp. CAU 1602]MCS1352178.1 spore germination protein [Mechercharimyces sp. CAU 1602]